MASYPDYKNTHFLYPGAIFAHTRPYQVTTVLGSCVAVCLYDPILQIGGINHYMLPLWNGQGLASPQYGDIAIEKLIEKMVSTGARKSRMKAKVFGGAEVLQDHTSHFNIGKKNVNLAYQYLEQNNIPIVAKSIGGNMGRKIFFCTDTGSVRQKMIHSSRIEKPA